LCNAPATARELSALWTALELTPAFRPPRLPVALPAANERLLLALPADRDIPDLALK
jgi:hypothetical protein